jgi:bis(5'-nucleosyl)-tetraphosphatase (symmetrical)
MQRIFLGDVQGCADELAELIARAKDEFGEEFSLWIAGDLINRGPDNLRPLECVRELMMAGRAEYVLGNHEINLLAVDFGLRELGPNDSFGDVLESSEAADWIDWLRSRALVVEGQLGDQRFAMVHASASPEWSLADLIEQGDRVRRRLSGTLSEAKDFLASDPDSDPVRDVLGRLTRCRSVAPSGDWSSAEPTSPDRAWHLEWADHSHDYGLVYGHWARQGLHVASGLRGLDTGCVHHGRGRDGFLTAWLPESIPRSDARAPFDAPDDRFWQIPARRRYYDPEVEIEVEVPSG